MGEVKLTAEQINAAKLILSKIVPDLARQELTGINGDAIKTETTIHNAGDVVLALLEEYKPVKKQ